MAARGRTIALWSAGLGVIVLLGGAVALRERILEEWHIHKLRTGNPEEARRAAEALGRMGSVRAVPALLEAPGRRRTEPAAKGGTGQDAAFRPLRELTGNVAGFQPTVPFVVKGNSDWQTLLSMALLGPASTGSNFLWSAQSGNVIIKMDGAEAVFDAFLWASAALSHIGERAVPALERAAADESLDPGTRAFAKFELARRALASPRIVLEGGSAEVSVEKRTSVPLPGSQGSVYLSAGDFEYRTVRVWVTPSTGNSLVREHSLATGEEVSFSVGGRSYLLRLEDIQDRFIGKEKAVFMIRKRSGE